MPLVQIRAVRKNDLPQVVAVHQQAFKGFHMTLLGPRFLARLLPDRAGLSRLDFSGGCGR
jgi:hypothetical protein